MTAAYRKHNDRSKNSSTYHKKDGTATRAILKREVAFEIKNAPRFVVMSIPGDRDDGSDTSWYVYDTVAKATVHCGVGAARCKDRDEATREARALNDAF